MEMWCWIVLVLLLVLETMCKINEEEDENEAGQNPDLPKSGSDHSRAMVRESKESLRPCAATA